MKAHLLQLDLIWEDRHANFELVEHALSQARIDPGDLVILPELFDSGFSLNTDLTADHNSETLRFLHTLADNLGITIQGSRTRKPDPTGKATNNATIVAPGGQLLVEYAKVHPFTFGKEPEAFIGGDDTSLYTWSSGSESLRVDPAVCYDLRFPELFRRGLLAGAEAFALGANWPESRQAHWRALAIARAIENQAYVFAVNRTGRDPHLTYAGGTIAIDPQGKILGELDAKPGTLTVDVDPESVRNWRSTFPAWQDLKILRLN